MVNFSPEAKSVKWQAPDVCEQPFHPGSDNHGQCFVCLWIVYREGLKLLSKMLRRNGTLRLEVPLEKVPSGKKAYLFRRSVSPRNFALERPKMLYSTYFSSGFSGNFLWMANNHKLWVMNTDAERNESKLVRQFLRYPLYFSSVYHKGYQFLICFLGTEAGFKELRDQHPSWIDWKTPLPN